MRRYHSVLVHFFVLLICFVPSSTFTYSKQYRRPLYSVNAKKLAEVHSEQQDTRDHNHVNIWRKFIPPDQQPVWTARAILLTVSAFYGTNFGCVKLLGDALDPGLAAALRFVIAFSVFSPSLWKVAKSNPSLILGGLEIGVYNSIGYWTQANALRTSSSSTVAFICSLQVIVVPIINAVMDRNKGAATKSAALSSLIPAILAVCGVACLELGGSTLPATGDLWALVQPLVFGFGFWRVEQHMKDCTQPGEAQGFTAASLAVVALFSLAWGTCSFLLPVLSGSSGHANAIAGAVATTSHGGGLEAVQYALAGQWHAIISDWRVLAALLWTGIVTTALTTFGENVAMKQLDAAESTVIYSTEPLWGTLFAAAALGEQVGWNTAAGAAFIIAACSWRSATAGVGFIGAVTAMQQSAMIGFEEVAENLSANISQLLEKFL